MTSSECEFDSETIHQWISQEVIHKKNMVTVPSISNQFRLKLDIAKAQVESFVTKVLDKDQDLKKKISIKYIVSGFDEPQNDEKHTTVHRFSLVSKSDIEEAKSRLTSIDSCYPYALELDDDLGGLSSANSSPVKSPSKIRIRDRICVHEDRAAPIDQSILDVNHSLAYLSVEDLGITLRTKSIVTRMDGQDEIVKPPCADAFIKTESLAKKTAKSEPVEATKKKTNGISSSLKGQFFRAQEKANVQKANEIKKEAPKEDKVIPKKSPVKDILDSEEESEASEDEDEELVKKSTKKAIVVSDEEVEPTTRKTRSSRRAAASDDEELMELPDEGGSDEEVEDEEDVSESDKDSEKGSEEDGSDDDSDSDDSDDEDLIASTKRLIKSNNVTSQKKESPVKKKAAAANQKITKTFKTNKKQEDSPVKNGDHKAEDSEEEEVVVNYDSSSEESEAEELLPVKKKTKSKPARSPSPPPKPKASAKPAKKTNGVKTEPAAPKSNGKRKSAQNDSESENESLVKKPAAKKKSAAAESQADSQPKEKPQGGNKKARKAEPAVDPKKQASIMSFFKPKVTNC